MKQNLEQISMKYITVQDKVFQVLAFTSDNVVCTNDTGLIYTFPHGRCKMYYPSLDNN